MGNRIFNPEGVPAPLGNYSHCGEVGPGRRVLHTAGQVARHEDGTIPGDFRDQALLVWARLKTILAANHMTLTDIVKIVVFLTDVSDIAVLREVLPVALGTGNRPASTVLVIQALAMPELKLEIELIAAQRV
ncbi:MAG: RidA family protein [Proteobacteria bacterium]|nr:RidA family protein [Pseudomonadota bacterium]